jgi:hypothetical protein
MRQLANFLVEKKLGFGISLIKIQGSDPIESQQKETSMPVREENTLVRTNL